MVKKLRTIRAGKTNESGVKSKLVPRGIKGVQIQTGRKIRTIGRTIHEKKIFHLFEF